MYIYNFNKQNLQEHSRAKILTKNHLVITELNLNEITPLIRGFVCTPQTPTADSEPHLQLMG